MSKFYYMIKTTTGDNVGSIEAADEKEAMANLKQVFAPPSPTTGEPHKEVTLELITKDRATSEKARIDKARAEEANFEIPSPEQTNPE